MSKKGSYEIIALIVVLFVATFLRLYRVTELTEFLGDQGRTGIHVYEAWKNKQLPLVGPTVLSGQHLGPAFYYILAPIFILTGFNPLAPAIVTALLGVSAVGLLWLLGKELFGWQIGTMLSLLWAVSPQIVTSDRVLWEPNIIPFFVFLLLISLFKKWNIVAGIALGILVQLHYPNLIFMGLVLLFGLNRYIVFGFLITLAPFLLYESQHEFKDVLGVLTNFSSGGQSRFLANVLDYSTRVMHRLAPFPGTFFLLFIPIFFKPTFWKKFIGLWLIIGLAAMSYYRGVVFDHYLFFLIPAAYLLFGFLLKLFPSKISIIVVSMITFMQLSKSDIFKPGVNDIERTRAVSQEIMRETSQEPFAFGLIASRSFSDLHYRYFFRVNETNPEPILSESYENLFFVCETETCTKLENEVQVLCYDDHCSGSYPIISLQNWSLLSSSRINNAQLYHYHRESVK